MSSRLGIFIFALMALQAMSLHTRVDRQNETIRDLRLELKKQKDAFDLEVLTNKNAADNAASILRKEAFDRIDIINARLIKLESKKGGR